ncbi:tannase/feruloyl esterase family alpha/beta hydrolase [Streptomyces sp. NPDC048419]|uniref:tannase/feruloyl esterase family alpha/beta hydrolase n=1 Tax=Streptomyces sp. NPDC048419 TaxID=3365547 RepID=UPI00371DC39F
MPGASWSRRAGHLNGLFQTNLHPVGSQLTWITGAFLLLVTVVELTLGLLGPAGHPPTGCHLSCTPSPARSFLRIGTPGTTQNSWRASPRRAGISRIGVPVRPNNRTWLGRSALSVSVLLAASVVQSSAAGATEVGAQGAESPRISCASLAGAQIPASAIALRTDGATITSATLVAASGTLPEYCAVRGTVNSVDASAPDIGFGVDVPTQWNGSAWQLGGGGNDGSVPNLAVTQLGQGYAVYGGDSGHQGQGVAWAYNDESWLNFSYQQIKKTHDAATDVLKLVYGHQQKLNYWQGTSQGGREGLEAVTRFPDDYNGVAVTVPLADFSSLMPNPVYLGSRQTTGATWIAPAQQTRVARTVLSMCDGLDNAVDGVINDYAACNHKADPDTHASDAFYAKLRCTTQDTSGDCLSAGRIDTLKKMYGTLAYPYRLANGRTDYAGWGTGMEGANGWLWSSTQPTTTQTAGFGIGWPVLQAHLSGTDAGTYAVGDFGLLKEKDTLRQMSYQLDISSDLDRWIARGGKLLMVTNASDAISNPRAQMALYQRWATAYGHKALDRHVRYYVDPNQGHVGGGKDATGATLPSTIDMAGYLVNWVEKGVAPGKSLIAYNTSDPATATYSKPVCSYPTYPRYRGTGALTSASSYTCAS